jgi:hypothetical protein
MDESMDNFTHMLGVIQKPQCRVKVSICRKKMSSTTRQMILFPPRSRWQWNIHFELLEFMQNSIANSLMEKFIIFDWSNIVSFSKIENIHTRLECKFCVYIETVWLVVAHILTFSHIFFKWIFYHFIHSFS